MTPKEREVMELALEAIEHLSHNARKAGVEMGLAFVVADEAITAIKAALEAHKALAQQCVCGEPNSAGTHRTDGPCLAPQPAVAEQHKQEPVALETVYETIIQWDEGGGKRSRRELARRIVSLYTTPPYVAICGSTTAPLPQRPSRSDMTWVGLDWNEMPEIYMNDKAFEHGVQWAETKLKEKNTK